MFNKETSRDVQKYIADKAELSIKEFDKICDCIDSLTVKQKVGSVE